MTHGEVPLHATSVFEDRLTALASLLVDEYWLSKRRVKDALSDMLGMGLSVGSVSDLEGEMSRAPAPAAAEAIAFVQDAEAVNADETGLAQGREGGRAVSALLGEQGRARRRAGLHPRDRQTGETRLAPDACSG